MVLTIKRSFWFLRERFYLVSHYHSSPGPESIMAIISHSTPREGERVMFGITLSRVQFTPCWSGIYSNNGVKIIFLAKGSMILNMESPLARADTIHSPKGGESNSTL